MEKQKIRRIREEKRLRVRERRETEMPKGSKE